MNVALKFGVPRQFLNELPEQWTDFQFTFGIEIIGETAGFAEIVKEYFVELAAKYPLVRGSRNAKPDPRRITQDFGTLFHIQS